MYSLWCKKKKKGKLVLQVDCPKRTENKELKPENVAVERKRHQAIHKIIFTLYETFPKINSTKDTVYPMGQSNSSRNLLTRFQYLFPVPFSPLR